MASCSRILVFVYGTLCRGRANHSLLRDVIFAGVARTCNRFPLVLWTQFRIPFVLNCPGLGHCIKGELYAVNEAQLLALDRLENHPSHYTRCDIHVKLESGEIQQAQAYLLPAVRYHPSLLERSEYLQEYDDVAASQYIAPSARPPNAQTLVQQQLQDGIDGPN